MQFKILEDSKGKRWETLGNWTSVRGVKRCALGLRGNEETLRAGFVEERGRRLGLRKRERQWKRLDGGWRGDSKAKLIPEGLQLLGEEGDGYLARTGVFRQDKKVLSLLYWGKKPGSGWRTDTGVTKPWLGPSCIGMVWTCGGPGLGVMGPSPVGFCDSKGQDGE